MESQTYSKQIDFRITQGKQRQHNDGTHEPTNQNDKKVTPLCYTRCGKVAKKCRVKEWLSLPPRLLLEIANQPTGKTTTPSKTLEPRASSGHFTWLHRCNLNTNLDSIFYARAVHLQTNMMSPRSLHSLRPRPAVQGMKPLYLVLLYLLQFILLLLLLFWRHLVSPTFRYHPY